MSSRIKTFVVTVLIGLAAPRIARVLRGYGHRHRRSGGGTMTTTVPLTAADALDKIAIWARPSKKRR